MNRVITRLDELPRGASLITGQDGTFQTCPGLAALSDGQTAWILAKPDLFDSTEIFALRNELENAGYAVEAVWRVDPSVIDALSQTHTIEETETESDTHEEFGQIVNQALEMGASDVHLRYRSRSGAVWFRIDKLLHHHRDMPAARIHSMAQAVYNTLADTDSKSDTAFNPRAPQDASVPWPSAENVKVRIRYQTLPQYPSGYDCVLRLLRTDAHLPTEFADLGFSALQTEMLNRVATTSKGLVVICGVTGSGKTTTLRALLYQVSQARPDFLIRTAENPPEHIIPGASQTPVTARHSEGGYSQIIKALLRSDPDVLMVGEINNQPTAELVRDTVLSGHPVFSTVHASDPFAIVERLEELGLKRSVLGNPGFFSALIHQELLPQLCRHCRVPYVPEEHPELSDRLERKARELEIEKSLTTLYDVGPGCANCHERGISGVTAAAQIVLPNLEIKRAVSRGDDHEARSIWRNLQDRDQTALEHAFRKMFEGHIAPRHLEYVFGQLKVSKS